MYYEVGKRNPNQGNPEAVISINKASNSGIYRVWESSWFIPISLIHDPYELHRFIWKAFPVSTDRPFLFAVKGARDRFLAVDVRSSEEPKTNVFMAAKKRHVYSIETGDRLRFEVIINPTWCDSQTRKRMPIYSHTGQINWIAARPNSGFKLISAQVMAQWDVSFYKKRTHGVIHKSWLVGKLEIVNPELFALVLTNGIGRGRSFGCGMLEIKKGDSQLRSSPADSRASARAASEYFNEQARRDLWNSGIGE